MLVERNARRLLPMLAGTGMLNLHACKTGALCSCC